MPAISSLSSMASRPARVHGLTSASAPPRPSVPHSCSKTRCHEIMRLCVLAHCALSLSVAGIHCPGSIVSCSCQQSATTAPNRTWTYSCGIESTMPLLIRITSHLFSRNPFLTYRALRLGYMWKHCRHSLPPNPASCRVGVPAAVGYALQQEFL